MGSHKKVLEIKLKSDEVQPFCRQNTSATVYHHIGVWEIREITKRDPVEKQNQGFEPPSHIHPKVLCLVFLTNGCKQTIILLLRL